MIKSVKGRRLKMDIEPARQRLLQKQLPIRVRLTLWYSGVLTFIVVSLGAFLVLQLRNDLQRELDDNLAARGQEIVKELTAPQTGRPTGTVLSPPLADITPSRTAAQILGPGGRVVQSSGGKDVKEPLIDPSGVGTSRSAIFRTTPELGIRGESYRVWATRLVEPGQVLVIAASTEEVERAVQRLVVLLLFAGPVAVALSGLVGYLLAGRAMGPIDRMTRSAAAISSSDVSARLEVPSVEDEVGRLGKTLNQMLARLEAGAQKQRRFTSDASHELRTPLSILASEIDVALRSSQTPPDAAATLTSLRQEVSRMTRIVEDLLMLTRMDAELKLSVTPVDLLDLVRWVAGRFATSAKEKDLLLEVEGQPGVIWADEEKLSQVLYNLIDNAIKHTPGGGTVRLSVDRRDEQWEISVADTGAGIPEEALPHIFNRFYRVDQARARSQGGTGLGLAICQSIVAAHQGTIDIDSRPGAGTTVKVVMGSRILNSALE